MESDTHVADAQREETDVVRAHDSQDSSASSSSASASASSSTASSTPTPSTPSTPSTSNTLTSISRSYMEAMEHSALVALCVRLQGKVMHLRGSRRDLRDEVRRLRGAVTALGMLSGTQAPEASVDATSAVSAGRRASSPPGMPSAAAATASSRTAAAASGSGGRGRHSRVSANKSSSSDMFQSLHGDDSDEDAPDGAAFPGVPLRESYQHVHEGHRKGRMAKAVTSWFRRDDDGASAPPSLSRRLHVPGGSHIVSRSTRRSRPKLRRMRSTSMTATMQMSKLTRSPSPKLSTLRRPSKSPPPAPPDAEELVEAVGALPTTSDGRVSPVRSGSGSGHTLRLRLSRSAYTSPITSPPSERVPSLDGVGLSPQMAPSATSGSRRGRRRKSGKKKDSVGDGRHGGDEADASPATRAKSSPSWRKKRDAIFSTAMFGQPLDRVMARQFADHPTIMIPKWIDVALQSLLLSALRHEGLFRLSGQTSKVQQVQARIDAGKGLTQSDLQDPDVIATLVKQYLRELPEPLLPSEDYEEYIAITSSPQDEVEALLRPLIERIPRFQRHLLYELCAFFAQVAKNHHANKMSFANVGIILGPNILRPPRKGAPESEGPVGPSGAPRATVAPSLDELLAMSSSSANVNQVAELLVQHAQWVRPPPEWTAEMRQRLERQARQRKAAQTGLALPTGLKASMNFFKGSPLLLQRNDSNQAIPAKPLPGTPGNVAPGSLTSPPSVADDHDSVDMPPMEPLSPRPFTTGAQPPSFSSSFDTGAAAPTSTSTTAKPVLVEKGDLTWKLVAKRGHLTTLVGGVTGAGAKGAEVWACDDRGEVHRWCGATCDWLGSVAVPEDMGTIHGAVWDSGSQSLWLATEASGLVILGVTWSPDDVPNADAPVPVTLRAIGVPKDLSNVACYAVCSIGTPGKPSHCIVSSSGKAEFLDVWHPLGSIDTTSVRRRLMVSLPLAIQTARVTCIRCCSAAAQTLPALRCSAGMEVFVGTFNGWVARVNVSDADDAASGTDDAEPMHACVWPAPKPHPVTDVAVDGCGRLWCVTPGTDARLLRAKDLTAVQDVHVAASRARVLSGTAMMTGGADGRVRFWRTVALEPQGEEESVDATGEESSDSHVSDGGDAHDSDGGDDGDVDDNPIVTYIGRLPVGHKRCRITDLWRSSAHQMWSTAMDKSAVVWQLPDDC